MADYYDSGDDSQSSAQAGSATPPSAAPAPALPAAASALNQSKKRDASQMEPGTEPPKITKRRAARACVSCRARKVRCDVVEGAPCGNCRWDNVACVVQESRRRKLKTSFPTSSTANTGSGADISIAPASAEQRTLSQAAAGLGLHISNASSERQPNQRNGLANGDVGVGQLAGAGLSTNPETLLSKLGDSTGLWNQAILNQTGLLEELRTPFLGGVEEPELLGQLPAFIKPLPSKIKREDVKYLDIKGALTLPSPPLQKALIQSYVEFVHPFMPILELHEFLDIVNSADGVSGQVSLLLYQAVMFVASTFVPGKLLKEAGFAGRRAVRKEFYRRTRLLYDFDYEGDRLTLVQALLLMTFWYETPEDQKDTWHWMGVALSVAHTVGLHRNPANTTMASHKKKLWRRIWWVCFVRDRLIALGMRRPTRIKDEDFDVPMIEVDDFELEPLSDEIRLISPECKMIRRVDMQRELALIYIEMAKLCIGLGRMIKAQYSVLTRESTLGPDNTANVTMLFPNKNVDSAEKVRAVDLELATWYTDLPPECQYRPLVHADIENGASTIAVQRNFLHMVYQTTVSALHRPQFLPSSPQHAPTVSQEVQEMSRRRVRDAAGQITRMSAELNALRLERYLPTSGVTVVLPAMIIHLLEMKNSVYATRAVAARGFAVCMRVMENMRDMYAAADFACGFLEAALRKATAAGIDTSSFQQARQQRHQQQQMATPGKPLNGNFSTGVGMAPVSAAGVPRTETPSTPPPETARLGTVHEPKFTPQHLQGRSAAVTPSGPGHYSPPQTETHSEDAVAEEEEDDDNEAEEGEEERDSSAEGADAGGIAGGLPSGGGLDNMYGMQEEFDWNAITGPSLDFDQWLQFPAEGVNNSDETFMDIFGRSVAVNPRDV